MAEAQDRPATPWHAQGVPEPRPRTAAHRETPVPERRTHAPTVAATDRDAGWTPLRTNPPPPGGVPAEDATDLQRQEALDPGTRQGGNRALGETMPGSRPVPAARTHR
jgi:hypothetical protein